MTTVTLVHGEAAFTVSHEPLKQACDLFADGPAPSRYPAQSDAPLGVFRSFLEAVKGNDIQITNENVLQLSQLCEEFGFWSLSSKLSAFRDSPEHRIWAVKARVAVQEQTVRTELTEVRRRISALEGPVSEQEQANAALRTKTQNQLAAEVRACSDEAKQSEQERAIAALKAWTGALDLLTVSDFPLLFAEFRGKRFALLWRGSRDGFGAKDFHGRASTLTLILDTGGNVFGGFTPLEWESRVWNRKKGDESNCRKSDDSLKSFIFTLKNPHNISARRFALKAEEKRRAISCDSLRGMVHFFIAGLLFPITATQTPTVSLNTLAKSTPTTPNWTGRRSSRVHRISR
jgi:uncharacterized coiled-coil protein SlyX